MSPTGHALRPRWSPWLVAAIGLLAAAAVAGLAVTARRNLPQQPRPASEGLPVSAPDSDAVERGSQASWWGSLADRHGAEAAVTEAPAGWQWLEFGHHRLAVPGGWVVVGLQGCPSGSTRGMVLVQGREGSGCPIEGDGAVYFGSDPRYIGPRGTAVLGNIRASAVGPGEWKLDDATTVSIDGPQAEEIAATVTDSGAVRVLQSGPIATTEGWQQVEFGPVGFLVPPAWRVVDLASAGVSGPYDPGVCPTGQLFPETPTAFIGTSTVMPPCPPSDVLDLRPAAGLWIREIDAGQVDDIGYARVDGVIDGLDVAVHFVPGWSPGEPRQSAMYITVHSDGRVWLVVFGVGDDIPTARAVLRSLHPTA